MKKVKSFLMKFAKDESGQGTAEYVLLIVGAVALVLAVGKPIKEAIMKKVTDTSGQIDGFNGN